MRRKPTRNAGRPTRGRVAFALFCALVAFGLTAAALRSFRGSADPSAVAVIERMQARPAPSGSAAVEPAAPADEPGVKITHARPATPGGPAIITVPGASEPVVASVDPRLTERSAAGLLPRIGEGGRTPFAQYARPFAATNRPKIAVVMTGVGIGSRGTAEAIAKLPGEVTLAFAPYGRDLENQVARARRDGHEILLQVPMEPFDYPDNDPGPHTLRAGAPAKENLERLHWLMARFPGYVGLTNFLGGKILSRPDSIGGVLEELGRRGLGFLDDGTTGTSRAGEHARRLALPFAKADRVVDGSADQPSLKATLAEIEAIARKNGQAIVMVPALPANIDMLANWQGGLAAGGIALAPLSAIMAKRAR